MTSRSKFHYFYRLILAGRGGFTDLKCPPGVGVFLRLDVRLYVFVHPEGLKGQIQVFLDNSIFL